MRESRQASQLNAMLKSAIAAGKQGRVPLAEAIKRVPASNYTDPRRFELELERIFRRLPLMLATTVELPTPGDFKTVEAAGVPVLISRQKDGEVRAFVNSCTHRGTKIVTAPSGNSRMFICPYHGWSFAQGGQLLAVAAADEFGSIDKGCYALKSLPVTERAGLIWVCLDVHSTLDFDAFLSGYDVLLKRFDLANWHLFARQDIRGPNWKVAYDGYLDFYHVAVLHKATIGQGLGNQAIYSAWGPHQRVIAPAKDFAALEAMAEEDWPVDALMRGVWTVFPHISIASFNAGQPFIMLSQLLPGDTVEESVTTQLFLTQKVPDEAAAKKAAALVELLRRVVEDEDYLTGRMLQRGLKSGAAVKEVTFGRNEGGPQLFHSWVDRLLAADDDNLNSLFIRPDESLSPERLRVAQS